MSARLKAVLSQMQDCIDDPMWADHTEMSKRLLRRWLEVFQGYMSMKPSGYAYRYPSGVSPEDTVIRFHMLGETPIETIPYYFGLPPATDPIDMVLHCPKCGMQHIDAPEDDKPVEVEPMFLGRKQVGYSLKEPIRALWTNPPHRSHLCAGCGHIWRPADVCTNGVKAIKTKGANDD